MLGPSSPPLSSIAYVLNICDAGSLFNMLPRSCLFVSFEHATLFTDSAELTHAVSECVDILSVETKEYNQLWRFLERKEWDKGKVIISPQTPFAIFLKLGDLGCTVLPFVNHSEIDDMGHAYLRYGTSYMPLGSTPIQPRMELNNSAR